MGRETVYPSGPFFIFTFEVPGYNACGLTLVEILDGKVNLKRMIYRFAGMITCGVMILRQLRLFVAIHFPEQVNKILGSMIQDLRKLPSDARWVEEDNIHLTVQFLGDVQEEQTPALIDALTRAALGVAPFKLALGGVGVFPSGERPRVLWAGVSGETAVLSRLQRQVQKELAELGYTPEKCRFSPHLTLARFRSSLGFPAVMERAQALEERLGQVGAVMIPSMELMRSELGPKGPKYFILARIALSGLKKAPGE